MLLGTSKPSRIQPFYWMLAFSKTQTAHCNKHHCQKRSILQVLRQNKAWAIISAAHYGNFSTRSWRCNFQAFNHGIQRWGFRLFKKIKEKGHQIVFTTARKSSNNNIPSLQLDLTVKRLSDAGIEYESIVGNLSSPRIVVNDDGAFAVNHERDCPIIHDQGAEYL